MENEAVVSQVFPSILIPRSGALGAARPNDLARDRMQQTARAGLMHVCSCKTSATKLKACELNCMHTLQDCQGKKGRSDSTGDRFVYVRVYHCCLLCLLRRISSRARRMTCCCRIRRKYAPTSLSGSLCGSAWSRC